MLPRANFAFLFPVSLVFQGNTVPKKGFRSSGEGEEKVDGQSTFDPRGETRFLVVNSLLARKIAAIASLRQNHPLDIPFSSLNSSYSYFPRGVKCLYKKGLQVCVYVYVYMYVCCINTAVRTTKGTISSC